MARKLTAKQQTFVNEYLIDLSATQAAIRAGYSVKNAGKIGSQLLEKTRVKEAIDKAKAIRARRTTITQDRVLREFARIGFYDPRALFNEDDSPKSITELDDDTAAIVAGLEVMEVYEGRGEDRTFVGYIKKYKLADKKAALDSIAKHLGMFIDRHEHSGPGGGPIEVTSPREQIASRIAGLAARTGETENP